MFFAKKTKKSTKCFFIIMSIRQNGYGDFRGYKTTGTSKVPVILYHRRISTEPCKASSSPTFRM